MFKTINIHLFKVTSLLPLISLFILYLFLLSCIIDLNHYPIPSTNDPKGIGLTILYKATRLAFIAAFFGSFLWLITLSIGVYHKIVSKKHLILFVAGILICIIQFVYDPGNVIYWYMD